MPTRKNTLRQHARRRIAASNSEIRGVALQTVIVIVVLLVIAGSVSAVLLSRSSDVVATLEDQSIGGLTADTCPITRIGGTTGQLADADQPAITAPGDITHCVWAVTTISAAQCFAGSGGSLKTGHTIAVGILGVATGIDATDEICLFELPT